MKTQSLAGCILLTLALAAAVATGQQAARPSTQPSGGAGMYGPGGGTGMYGGAPTTQPRGGTGMYGPGAGTGMYSPGGGPATQPRGGTGMYSPGGGTGMYGPGRPGAYGGGAATQPRGGTGMYGPGGGTGMYGPGRAGHQAAEPAAALRPLEVDWQVGQDASLYHFVVEHDDWVELPALRREFPFIGVLGLFGEQGLDRTTLTAMLEKAPPGDLPPRPLVEMLRSDQHVLRIQTVTHQGPRRAYRVYLAGATVEQVEDLAAALVQVYNAAWAEVRDAYAAELVERLEDQREALKTARKQLDGLKKLIVSEAVLDELKAKAHMLRIEMAGLEARYNMAREIMQERRRSGGETQSLEDIIADAQTDLATTEAKWRATVEALHAAIRHEQESYQLAETISDLRRSVAALEEQAETLGRVLPLPPPEIHVDGGSIVRLVWPDERPEAAAP